MKNKIIEYLEGGLKHMKFYGGPVDKKLYNSMYELLKKQLTEIKKIVAEQEQTERLSELAPEFLKFVKEMVQRYPNSPWIYGNGQELIDRVNGKNSVLICLDCKSFWLSPIDQCSCGCKTLSSAHQSNKKYAINLKNKKDLLC